MGQKRNRQGVEARGSRIRITFHYQGERCRETLQIPPTPRNLEYAERRRSQILYEIEIGTFDYAATFPESARAVVLRKTSEATLSDRCDLWLKTRVLSATSRDRYRRQIKKHIDGNPELGPRPIARIISSELELWRAGLADKLKPKTVNNLLTVVRGSFELAHADNVIQANPAVRLVNLLNDFESDADPFSIDEMTAILGQFTGPELNMVDAWWTTGMREGELLGLEWGDIDWMKGTAHVRRALVEGRIVDVKTKKKGRREVKLPERALAALKRQRQHTELQGGTIFLNPDTGQPYSHAVVFYRKFQRALRRAKVRARPPKQLRHTYASMSLSAGEPPLFIMTQLGHTSLEMLQKHYAKWMPDVNKAAGEGFDRAASQVPGAVPALPQARPKAI